MVCSPQHEPRVVLAVAAQSDLPLIARIAALAAAGVNIAGITRILDLEDANTALRAARIVAAPIVGADASGGATRSAPVSVRDCVWQLAASRRSR